MGHLKEVPKEILESYSNLGYSQALIAEAYQICKNPDNPNSMIDAIDKLQKDNELLLNIAKKDQGPVDDDVEVNKAILASLETAKEQNAYVEFDNPVERMRKEGFPVGLKNIGNTCYFNSLLQTYFMYPEFVKEILHYKEKKLDLKDEYPNKERILASIKLVKALQHLFGMMIISNKKYVDPSNVLHSIVDDQGKNIPIGDQKDIGEFNLYFLARLEEGLNYSEKSEILKKESYEESLEKNISISSSNEKSLIRKLNLNLNDEKHMIFNLFFGKLVRNLRVNSVEEHKLNEIIEEEPFNMIILDLKFRDLYSSWEETMFEKIVDYRNEKNEVVGAERLSSIKFPPGTLFFQLQRLQFDIDKGITKKNDRFFFEKEIYVDRILEKNKQIFLQIRANVLILKEKASFYEQSLKKIKNYNNSNYGLDMMLAQAKIFLAHQTKEEQIKEIEGKDPTYFGCNMNDKLEIESCLGVLERYGKALDERLTQIEIDYENLLREVEESYRDLKSIKYRLLSILMHEGSAESGHYYSYICDFGQNIWRKYNDRIIKEVDEPTLMKEAIGGENSNNAYCLIYVQENLIYKPEDLPPRLYQLYDENNSVEDYYISLLMNSAIMNDIIADNVKFAQETHLYKTRQDVKDIIDDYVKGLEYVNEMDKKLKEGKKIEKKPKLPHMLNFCVYLKEEAGNEDFIKYHLLNDALHRKQFGEKNIVYDLSESKNMPEVIKTCFEESFKNMSNLRKPNLNINLKNYDEKIKRYAELVHLIFYSIYAFEKAVKGKFDECFFAANILLNLSNPNNSSTCFYFKLISEFIKIVILSLPQKILLSGNEEEFFHYLNTLVAAKLYYFKEDFITNIYKVQMQVIFTDIKKIIVERIPAYFSVESQKKALELFSHLEKEPISIDNNLFKIKPDDLDSNLAYILQDNDPFRIDIFKIDDLLVNAFDKNFEEFKSTFDPWCKFLILLKNASLPFMSDELKKNKVLELK